MSAILDYGPLSIEKLLSEHHKNALIEFPDLKSMGIDTKFNTSIEVVIIYGKNRQNRLIDWKVLAILDYGAQYIWKLSVDN